MEKLLKTTTKSKHMLLSVTTDFQTTYWMASLNTTYISVYKLLGVKLINFFVYLIISISLQKQDEFKGMQFYKWLLILWDTITFLYVNEMVILTSPKLRRGYTWSVCMNCVCVCVAVCRWYLLVLGNTKFN